MSCKFSGCKKESRLKRGYCIGHYSQLRNNNWDESKLIPMGKRYESTCIYTNPDTGIKCENKHVSRGYCIGHYHQFKNNNWDESKLRPLTERMSAKDTPDICSFIDPETNERCFKKHSAKGYCSSHWNQLRNNDWDISKLKPINYQHPKSKTGLCTYIDPETGEKCNKSYFGKGYCSSHWNQLRKNNYDESKLTPIWDRSNRDFYYQKVFKNYPGLIEEELNRKWGILGIKSVWNPRVNKQQGRYIIHIKYVGSMKEKGQNFSRHLMELKEERLLNSDFEHVDHIDENKRNDHIDNLQILTSQENAYKTQVYKHDEVNKVYNFICPCCGNKADKPLVQVQDNWNINESSGPTCSKKCSSILHRLKSINRGKFKSDMDDIIGRFINGQQTKGDIRLVNITAKDLYRLKCWRLYFKLEKDYDQSLKVYKDKQPIDNRYYDFIKMLSEHHKQIISWKQTRELYYNFIFLISDKDIKELIFVYANAIDQNLARTLFSDFKIIYKNYRKFNKIIFT